MIPSPELTTRFRPCREIVRPSKCFAIIVPGYDGPCWVEDGFVAIDSDARFVACNGRPNLPGNETRHAAVLTRIISTAVTVTMLICSTQTHAQSGTTDGLLPSVDITIARNWTVNPCLVMPGIVELCSEPPTIWLNPDLEPRDEANRLLGAFQAMGYIASPKASGR